MSQYITEAFRQEFADNFMHVAQQMKSRLEGAVMMESGIRGISKTINRLGQRTAQRRITRHGDTPINDQPHSTRFIDLFDYEDGDMIDDQDKIRMLADPQSEYVRAMVQAMNRIKDDVIISALQGTARTTTGTVALPSTQKIAVGAAGLTKAKIIQARQILRGNEADDWDGGMGDELYFAYASQQMGNILADTQLTSADYLSVQFLQEGKVGTKWMGFTWIPIERLPKASTSRFNYAWAKSGVCLGVGENITTKVGEDPSKAFNVRAYAKQSLGAVRVEEEKVVEIACLES